MNTKKKLFTMLMPVDLDEKLNEISKQTMLSKSLIIRIAVKKYLEGECNGNRIRKE